MAVSNDLPLFLAGHITSCYGSCECLALSPITAACRWLLLLLSPLLSIHRRPSGGKPTCTLQGMARVRSGQALACPLSSDRSVRRGSRVKRDFACTFTGHLPLCLLPCVTVTLEAGGADTYTQRAIPGSEPSLHVAQACTIGLGISAVRVRGECACLHGKGY